MGIWERYRDNPKTVRAERHGRKPLQIESVYVTKDRFADWKKALQAAGFGEEEIEGVLLPAVVEQGMKDSGKFILDKLEAITTAMTPEEKEAQRKKLRDILIADHRAALRNIE